MIDSGWKTRHAMSIWSQIVPCFFFEVNYVKNAMLVHQLSRILLRLRGRSRLPQTKTTSPIFPVDFNHTSPPWIYKLDYSPKWKIIEFTSKKIGSDTSLNVQLVWYWCKDFTRFLMNHFVDVFFFWEVILVVWISKPSKKSQVVLGSFCLGQVYVVQVGESMKTLVFFWGVCVMGGDRWTSCKHFFAGIFVGAMDEINMRDFESFSDWRMLGMIYLGGGFKYFLFSSLFGEDSHLG